MNTKGMKFLAVLAVLAMAFAAFAVVAPAETDDAATKPSAEGLYTYADGEYTIVTATGNTWNVNSSMTVYAYTADTDKIVAIDYDIVLASGVELTIDSYGDDTYLVKVNSSYGINISASDSTKLILDGADLQFVGGGTKGSDGLVGGMVAGNYDAKGTAIVMSGSKIIIGFDTSGSTEITANLKVYAGGEAFYGPNAQYGGPSSVEADKGYAQIGAFGKEAIITPSKSSAGDDAYVLVEMKKTSNSYQRVYTFHMDVAVNDKKYASASILGSSDVMNVPEDFTMTVVELTGAGTEGIPYGATIVNEGTIDVTGKMYFASTSSSASVKDTSQIGILGDGTVNVKKNAVLVITEGSAKSNQTSPATISGGMFATGNNEIVVSEGGKLFAQSNAQGGTSGTIVVWGIVGDTASAGTSDLQGTYTTGTKAWEFPSKFIWALGTSAKMTIEAKYTYNAAGTETKTSGAVYKADGTVTIGSTIGTGYDWADRFDEVIINSGTTTISKGFSMAQGYDGPSLTVKKGATLTMGSIAAHSQKTFSVANGATVYVEGTLDISAGSDYGGATTGQVVVLGGTFKYYDPDATAETAVASCVKYQTGKVEVLNSTTTLDLTPETSAAMSVKTIDALEKAVEEETKKIELTGNVTLDEDLTIPNGVSLDNKTFALTVPDGKALKLETGAAITGNVTINGVTVKFGSFSGAVTLSQGSVKINGVIAGGSIDIGGITKDIIITGSLNDEFEIKATTDVGSGHNVIFKNFTVNSTGKLKLNNIANITYKVADSDSENKYYMYVYGAIVPGITPVQIDVPQVVDGTKKYNSSFIAYSGAQISGNVIIAGNGTIDLSQAQKTQKVDEDISADKVYGQLEDVEIIGSLSIGNNSTVTIQGTITINEGVVLTIERGSSLVVSSKTASVVIDGKLIVEEGAFFTVTTAKGVDVSGQLLSSGMTTINSNLTIKKGGSADFRDDTGSTITVTAPATVKVAKGATMTIRTSMNIANIENSGEVILNGAILSADSKISMAASGAIVNVKAIQSAAAGNDLTITDLGLSFADSSKVVAATSNTVVITPAYTSVSAYDVIRGLTATEVTYSYDYLGSTIYANYMELSGTLTDVDQDGAAYHNALAVAVSGNDVKVTETLAIGSKVELVNSGNLNVSGTIRATADESKINNDAGVLTVTGLVQTVQKIGETGTINAAYYEKEVDDKLNYFYTNFKDALASGNETVVIKGTVNIDESMEIAAPTVVKNNGTLKIGTDNNATVVTVKDGASIKGGNTIVSGTLVFENKKDNKTTVESDVSVIGEVSSKYTNVYTAVSQAQADDVVTITREGTTALKNSLTIPAGVTLDVPASKTLQLAPGVTLTVNGTLQTAEAVKVDKTTYEDAAFDTKASLLNHTAAIVVNGVFKSLTAIEYKGTATMYKIPGAYYSFADGTGNYYYVSPVAVAVGTAARTITTHGEVSAGFVEWAGTSSSDKTFNVADDSEFTATEMKLAYVKFNVAAAGSYTGAIAYGNDAVIASEVSNMAVKNSKIGNAYVMFVEKATVPDTDDSKFAVALGTVYAKTINGDLTVADGATLAVLNADNPLTINGDLVVYGTLFVDNGFSAIVNGGTEIFGAVIVATESEDGTKAKGSLTLDEVFLGISKKIVLGAAASITGAVDFDILYAAAGSSVSQEILDIANLKYTEFYVGTDLYLTAYTTANTYEIDDVEYEIEIADFKGWYNLHDESASEKDAKIGQTGWEIVVANIDYDVYTLIVKTDDGVKSVAVDGKELISGGLIGQNVFISKVDDKIGFNLAAGKYVISFTLKDGYEGTPILYDADGKAVIGGYGITITGDAEHRIITYQLSGTEQIIAPEPTPVEQNEWTITTILLVILVILIAIMAVIVALRLNRS